MSLGQNIYNLRKEKNLSQGDLAEMLDVSRQSISKWETDASVPELDKLVKMSRVFGVTVDELIKGYTSQPSHDTQPSPSFETPQKKLRGGRMAAVVILMSVGGFAFLLFTVFGGLLTGLVMAAPFICCGIICIVSRKRPLLWCLWALFIMADIYLSYATGAGFMAFSLYLIETGLTVQTLISGIRLAVYLVLVVFTAISFRRSEIKNRRAGVIWLIISAVALVIIPVVSFFFGRAMFDALYSGATDGGLELTVGTDEYERHLRLMWLNNGVNFLLGWLRYVFFTVAVTLGVNMISNRKKNK